jgi:phosphate transport system permease protein
VRLALPPTGRSEHLGDLVFRIVCQAAAVAIVLLALLLLGVVLAKSWLALSTVGPSFFTSRVWDPEPEHRQFGALAFVWGTVVTSAIAMLIAVPLGVGTATFLSEIAQHSVRRVGSFLVEMLAAVPSVVYGFWGLFILGPALQSLILKLGGPNTGGVGILPAGLILAIMIVPYIAAVSFDVCRAVPRSQREGSLALGATRWQTIWSVVLPYARPGIIGGCFLALGRALGETMAVTMLIGNRSEISLSPFALGNSIASVIANEYTEATYDLYLSALTALGFVLLAVTVIVNSLARVLIWRVTNPVKWTTLVARFTRLRKPSAALEPALANHAERAPRTSVVNRVAPRLARPRPDRPPSALATPASRARARWANRVMTVVLGSCLAVTVGFLLLILGYLIYQGVGAINWQFFVRLPAPPLEKGGGMANAIYGSALLVGLATLMAVPIGLLAAIYLSEYRNDRLGPTVRFVGELLGGVPSIVIGIFAYALLVRPLQHFSGWAGGFALGIMMIPIVMRASEEAIKLVPSSLRQASFALGATHWQTVVRVSVPAALPAIITAVFLAIARVAGETAPLLLTASSNNFWPRSPGDSTPSLPVFIFNYAISPYDNWHRQAWAAAFVLVVFIMMVNFGVRALTGKRILLASHAD